MCIGSFLGVWLCIALSVRFSRDKWLNFIGHIAIHALYSITCYLLMQSARGYEVFGYILLWAGALGVHALVALVMAGSGWKRIRTEVTFGLKRTHL